jgi:hypothetical protein
MWTAIAIGYVLTLSLFLVGWARWQDRMAKLDEFSDEVCNKE